MKKLLIPALFGVLFSTTFSAQKTTSAPAKVETVKSKLSSKEVIDNYIKALGGKAQLEAVKTTITENTISVQGMEVTMITKKMGNKFKSVQSVMGQEMVQLFDGEKGYFDQMGNKMDIPADKIAELKKGRTIDALSYDPVNFKTVTTENISGKAYNVLSSEKGKFFFDAMTGLLYKSETGEGNATINSYLTVDGLKFPSEINAVGGGQNLTIKTTKVTVNSGVTDQDFK